MNNEAVLDRETGLTWERRPDGAESLNFAKQVCRFKSVGGRKGCCLPSIHELNSLIDPTRSNPALPIGHPFLGVQSSNYWSATVTPDFANVFNENVGRFIDFNTG